MFSQARLKLTAWYVIIIMLVSLSFSAVIYRFLTIEINRFSEAQRIRIERRMIEGRFFPGLHLQIPVTEPLVDPDLIEGIRNRIRLILFLVNGGILTLSAGLAYFLAGRTLAPIKDMVDEQNRFVSDASHELRTPLTSLKSAMEVHLRDKKATRAEAESLIKESITEVDKLQTLSDSLLSLAQYHKPNGNLIPEQLNLEQIINESAKKIEPLAKKKNIVIEKDIAEVTVKGNKYGLVDLLVILLDNAIKYSYSGKKIAVNVKKSDGTVKISVKDEGVGISQTDLPHIFDRFYRADSARSKSKIDGYGLGLSIAQKIIKNHRGTLTVKSKIGQGSTFTVQLPLA